MAPAGFKPAVLASERSQTHSSHRAATGIANTAAADTKAKLIAFCVSFNGAAKCEGYRASKVEELNVIMDYCSNDTDREMGGACSIYGGQQKCI